MDWSHACARCGKQVGLYPAGPLVLATEPDAAIVCSVCAVELLDEGDVIPLSNIEQELMESIANRPRKKRS
jgi:hypothetical protein